MNKIVLMSGLCLTLAACTHEREDSDYKQQNLQEKILAEATMQTGMPAIKNFRERKLMKDILELRDQENLATYTYLVSDYSAKLVFFCESIGYGLPYATQYTSPEKAIYAGGQYSYYTLPQADPNGLFSPSSAEGTWVMCKDPNGPDVKTVYVEPRIVVSPFKLTGAEPSASSVPAKAEKP